MAYYEKLKDFFHKDGKEVKKWRLLLIILLQGIKPDGIKRWCSEMKVKNKDMDVILETSGRWNEVRKNLKNIIKGNSVLYHALRKVPPELQIIACSWGGIYYKNIKKYLTRLSGIHLEVSGETLKDMGYRPSEKFRSVLSQLFEMKLDGKVSSRKDEIYNLRKLMEPLK